MSSSKLFRSEVAVSRSERVFGEVSVLIPASWQVIGYLLFAAVATAVLFASLATYARIETVGGSIVPAAGVAPIIPTRAGVIVSIGVVEGQTVKAGQVVAIVRSEEDVAVGESVGARIEDAISLQDSSLQLQLSAAQASALSAQRQFEAQRAGFAAEIGQLESQIAFQQTLIENSVRAYDRARRIAERGFISQRDLEALQDTVVSRRQAMSQLTQALASKRSQLAEAAKMSDQSRFQADAQVAALEASRAQLKQQAASAEGNRSYAIRSPLSGQIAALMARIGQPATTQASLMTVVPGDSPLRAELAVPSSAIGFVKRGQQVRLAMDSFPYQRFGTVAGTVLTVAASPISQPGPSGTAVSVYPVVVELSTTYSLAYGRRERLIPGMTLTARIVTDRQSLLQWLFDPLFAVSRR
ncbi:HlyD family efflux transporter periplasmic adaptor subunit [Stakelama sp. CBK3Z-3]|uniref:HlyD family efflux transporter periplasmic adaptor subunit n=1 Tax=Stakelama flava TaxID=2860338 RepID=A0ABS6XKH9_9SPHN|nr:HlyD family efflux transporter periplasmic adaptor subunit [Stakelama flava]MBW4329881.1 HlyD family efflux transporter periplasmic adaptor subunit [Stakelama flava]